MGAWARSAAPHAACVDEVSDQFGFGSEVGQFRERSLRSERKLAGLTAMAKVLPGRSLAGYCIVLGDRRSLAPYYGGLADMRSIAASAVLSLRGGARWFVTGLGSFRAAERSESDCGGGCGTFRHRSGSR